MNEIDYDNKEERKIFREALIKHFPLNNLQVVKQGGVGVQDSDSTVSLEDYFNNTKNNFNWTDCIYLKGRDNWLLRIEIDRLHDCCEFTDILNNERGVHYKMKYASINIYADDPIDLLARFLFSCLYEHRLAHLLIKLYKDAYNRHDDITREEKCKKLKKELL